VRPLDQADTARALKQGLRSEQVRLELLRRVRDSHEALALSWGQSDGQERENLEQFLANLPELWRQGEARPTHRVKAPS
jgi:hypothetical protein